LGLAVLLVAFGVAFGAKRDGDLESADLESDLVLEAPSAAAGGCEELC
jgi:hypothetical protein